jgi:hypothetical protein
LVARVLSTPTGWARANLHYLDGAPVSVGSLEEAIAVAAWRKRQRIELLRTIATVTAAVKPDRAAEALGRLIEEMFPEHAIERGRAVERALQIMDEERHKVYAVVPAGGAAGTRGRGKRVWRTPRPRPG